MDPTCLNPQFLVSDTGFLSLASSASRNMRLFVANGIYIKKKVYTLRQCVANIVATFAICAAVAHLITLTIHAANSIPWQSYNNYQTAFFLFVLFGEGKGVNSSLLFQYLFQLFMYVNELTLYLKVNLNSWWKL